MNIIKKFFCWLLDLVTEEEYEELKSENKKLISQVEDLTEQIKFLEERIKKLELEIATGEGSKKVTLTLEPNDEIDFYINNEPAGDKTSFTFNKYETVTIYAKAKNPEDQDKVVLYVDKAE